ncbi:hypothetical protein [Paenibacillus polymyxa]|uniref:hypothetical protein n=1 Tax=Paenibacillus polymyxa TaxID=1406 RepID=UPI0004DFCA05|nr:hypothetical protein [Paenibacillus polymyxa]
MEIQRFILYSFLEHLLVSGYIKDHRTIPTVKEAKEFLLTDIINKWRPAEDNKVLWLIDRDFGKEGSENEEF